MTLSRDFSAVRAELGLPTLGSSDDFPGETQAQAERIAATEPEAPKDLTAVPFVTIDPPGSKDLDQAVHLERDDDGFTVRYAIADLGAVIEPGSAIDVEARRRGQTIYLPDGRIPLHPPVLSEDASSLLPEQTRRAAVWTIAVAADGSIGEAAVERALVRSVARLDYAGVQESFDTAEPHPSIEALRDLGELRRTVRLAAGAIDLALPAQRVTRVGDAWTVGLEPRTASDAWNAEISLLTGMAAARMMLDAGVGLLRTLPHPPQDDVAEFLALARRLGADVPDGATPGQILAALDLDRPESLALMTHATRLLRGAGYVVVGTDDADVTTHAGIGGPYAHVTAPLRRLSDRFSTEICLAVSAEREPGGEWVAALPEIADRMRETDRLANDADRTVIDQAEVWVVQDHQDASFEAVVLRADPAGERSEVMVRDPLVLADCRGADLVDGARIRVRVAEIDAAERRVVYVTA